MSQRWDSREVRSQVPTLASSWRSGAIVPNQQPRVLGAFSPSPTALESLPPLSPPCAAGTQAASCYRPPGLALDACTQTPASAIWPQCSEVVGQPCWLQALGALHKTSGGAAPPVPCSGSVGAMGWLHQDPGPVDRRYRMFVRSGEQGVGPFLLYGQLQESPPRATSAPVEAHSLGYAGWAAEEGPLAASGRAADGRLGRHAIWNDVLEIRLRRFVLFFF